MSTEPSCKGIVFLIPTIISENTAHKVITPQIMEVVKKLNYFLVENTRTARRFISSLKIGINIEELNFELLDKNTPSDEVEKLMEPALKGKDIGILSEAGCPGIADPGATAVKFAHKKGIKVVPLVGPSSILLALMASGFNGQSFAFHGYLPIEAKEREKSLKEIEFIAIKKNQTQIFMETPYRNNKTFQDVIKICRADTLLCVAKDITGEEEFIKTQAISSWKSSVPDLQKFPVIFLIYSS
jgi:16S rRNA (cytidine1402-2'-O)-methyltransferase